MVLYGFSSGDERTLFDLLVRVNGVGPKFALAILEDLDRRGVLRRTPEGHVPGPRAGVPGALP